MPIRGILTACVGAILAITLPARAQTPVDLELVLALDASGSVDMMEWRQQAQGYAQAFTNPAVIQAIQAGPNRGIAVTMFQWSGYALQASMVGWTRITDAASAHAFAQAVLDSRRVIFGGGTSLSGAIDYGSRLFGRAFKGPRRVIDISGDGSNNNGRPVTAARDEAVKAAITINGLAILNDEPRLDAYYLDNVIGGANAFVLSAPDYEVFGRAILNKLLTEIAGAPPAGTLAARTD
jgi:hypothetical protein